MWRWASVRASVTRPAITSAVIRPKPLVNRSSPGWSAAVARRASASTSSNCPVRAELSAAAEAAHPTATASACGDSSTSPAIRSVRSGVPAFIAKVADNASRVVCAPGDETWLRVV